jgi:hypothetical protein
MEPNAKYQKECWSLSERKDLVGRSAIEGISKITTAKRSILKDVDTAKYAAQAAFDGEEWDDWVVV